MGMFDSIYDASGHEWQTKALGQSLTRYQPGSLIPGPPIDYQLEVIGDERTGFQWSYITLRSGRAVEIPSKRDETLPLLEFQGGWAEGKS